MTISGATSQTAKICSKIALASEATGKELVKMELFMMLNQLKGARECASLYLKLPEHPDDELRLKIGEAQEKINAAMNDVACVIGWDVLAQIEQAK